MKKSMVFAGVAALALVAAFAIKPASADGKEEVAKLDSYKPTAGIAGNIVSVGSDTLNNLMALWSEGFRKSYPNVTFSVEGKGSSTAPVALIENTADLGPMSREMKKEEIDKFEAKYGYKPTKIAVAIDALAVFVHKDNPVEGLTLQQVDAIFSSTRKGGYKSDITSWGQAGLKGDWANMNMTLYGRNSASGTYGFFKENALFKGDYKSSVKEQPGSSTVVQLIGEDKSGIGYSGIGYKTAGVRTVPLKAKEADKKFFDANEANCYSGDYPLSRFLLIYVNKAPGRGLPANVREFLRFVHHKEGQEIVLKDGFIPLTKDMTADEIAKYK